MSTSRNGWCQKDTASYKSLSDRWQTCRRLKQWWSGLSAELQAEWFLKQQNLPAGTKRRFDEVEYEETTRDQQGDIEDERDDYLVDVQTRWSHRGQQNAFPRE